MPGQRLALLPALTVVGKEYWRDDPASVPAILLGLGKIIGTIKSGESSSAAI